MKRYITILACLLPLVISHELRAQAGLNPNGTEPHPSAMLDVASTDKGLLVPRMSASQRDAITNPANGLLVFTTDDNRFYYYDGTGWVKVGPADPPKFILGKKQGNPNYKILELDQADGSLDLANGGVNISTHGTLSLSELDIKDSSPGTNAIQFRAENSTDKWLNFRSSGGSPAGRAGALFSQRNQLHYFLYSENQKLKLDLGNELSENPDVDLAVPIMELSSTNLHLLRPPRIATGNEIEGKVLTSDANGKADWTKPPGQTDKVVHLSDNTRRTIAGNASSTWVLSSGYTNWLPLDSGRPAVVRITFSAKLDGGGGNDPLRFRVIADGRNGCNTTDRGTTDYLDVYQEIRGHRIQTAIQGAIIADCNGSGEYRFALETDCSATDDNIEIDNVEITVIKY